MKNKILMGLAGSGKTTWVAKTYIPNHQDNLHIYFAPSINLGKEFARMVEGDVKTIIINSDDHTNVLEKVIEELNQCESRDQKVLIISTHQVYTRLRHNDLAKWNIYVDEALPDFTIHNVDFGQTGNIDAYFDNELLTLKAGLSDNPRDHRNLATPLRDLITKVGSGRYHATFTKLPDANLRAEAIVVPSEDFWIGKTITYIGAGVADTRIGQLIPTASVKTFKTNNSNHYSSKIKIRYYVDGSNSKYARAQSKEMVEKIIEDNDNFHADKNHIQWHNKYEEYGESLNHNIAGSNDFQDNDHATFFTSMNLPKHQVKVLEDINIDSEYLYEKLTLNTAYQCFMRTNLRKDEPTSGTTFTVLDSKLAYALKAKYFPNATIEKIGDFEWVKPEKKVSKAAKIGQTNYNKAAAIRKKNDQFKDCAVEELFYMLNANNTWNNYTSRGEKK